MLKKTTRNIMYFYNSEVFHLRCSLETLLQWCCSLQFSYNFTLHSCVKFKNVYACNFFDSAYFTCMPAMLGKIQKQLLYSWHLAMCLCPFIHHKLMKLGRNNIDIMVNHWSDQILVIFHLESYFSIILDLWRYLTWHPCVRNINLPTCHTATVVRGSPSLSQRGVGSILTSTANVLRANIAGFVLLQYDTF